MELTIAASRKRAAVGVSPLGHSLNGETHLQYRQVLHTLRYRIAEGGLPHGLPTAEGNILSPWPTGAISSVLGSQYSATSWFSGTQDKGTLFWTVVGCVRSISIDDQSAPDFDPTSVESRKVVVGVVGLEPTTSTSRT